MTRKKIFRQTALEQLSSPEQLDQLMHVTTSKGWLAMVGLIVVLVVMVAWGFFGLIPLTTTGQGLILKTGTIRNVTSPFAGRLQQLQVTEDMAIDAGQLVGQIFSQGDIVDVISPFEGQVSEIRADVGNVVEIGSPLFSMVLAEAAQQDLGVVAYLPAIEAKRVLPGMRVHVSPATVALEEYGFIVGEVAKVDEFPASRDGMQRTLGNEEWVEKFAAIEAPVELSITLFRESNHPDQYRWSSGQQPDISIGNGTPCTIEIILAEIPPVRLIVSR